jgi:hypothetical protein
LALTGGERQPRDSPRPHPLPDALADLRDRSASSLSDALAALMAIYEEMSALVEVTRTSRWSDDEFGRYVRLTGEERRAHRRYLAARDWYDGVRRRIRQRGGSM